MTLHHQREIERQSRRILIVKGPTRWYLRLPGYLVTIIDALKSLIPYERRLPKDGLGWHVEAQCWALSYDDYYDVLDLLHQLLPNVAAEEVDEMPLLERGKPYEDPEVRYQ